MIQHRYLKEKLLLEIDKLRPIAFFLEEVESLKEGLWIYTSEKLMNNYRSFLMTSISAYLIKKKVIYNEINIVLKNAF